MLAIGPMFIIFTNDNVFRICNKKPELTPTGWINLEAEVTLMGVAAASMRDFFELEVDTPRQILFVDVAGKPTPVAQAQPHA